MGPYERAFFKVGNVNVNSVHFSKTYIAMRDYYKINVLLADVSLPDDEVIYTMVQWGRLEWNRCRSGGKNYRTGKQVSAKGPGIRTQDSCQ